MPAHLAATLIAAFLLFYAFASAALEGPRVAFVNPPAFVPDTEIITYYVRTPRHPENRLLIVAAFDGSERVSYTERQLHGEHSQALWNINWRLPEGQLELVAVVFDGQRQVGRVAHPLTVYSRLPAH